MTILNPNRGETSPIFGKVCVIVLLGSSIGLLFSLYGQLFGPSALIILGILGFLSAAVGWGISQRLFLPAHPRGLADLSPRLRSLQAPTALAAKVVKLVAGISLVTMMLSARLDGVTSGGFPVFAARENYELNNHGKKIEVSKLRYWTIGVSFVLGWHSMALFFSVSSIRTFLFGESCNETNRRAP